MAASVRCSARSDFSTDLPAARSRTSARSSAIVAECKRLLASSRGGWRARLDHGRGYSIADISMLGWVRNLIASTMPGLVDFDQPRPTFPLAGTGTCPAGRAAGPRIPEALALPRHDAALGEKWAVAWRCFFDQAAVDGISTIWSGLMKRWAGRSGGRGLRLDLGELGPARSPRTPGRVCDLACRDRRQLGAARDRAVAGDDPRRVVGHAEHLVDRGDQPLDRCRPSSGR